MSKQSHTMFGLILAIALEATALAQPQLVDALTIPGNATDLFPGVGVNKNRLGGFGSAVNYDPNTGKYLALLDRGPGAGVVDFQTRLEVFDMDVNPVTGRLSNFVLEDTIPFLNADGTSGFNGLTPRRLNGDSKVLGLSLDAEGLAVAPNGNLIIADEYGPALYEFAIVDVEAEKQARFVRSFAAPDQFLPRNANGEVHYDAVRAPSPADPALTLISGRQDNRGYEGVTFSPDGKQLYATLQSPMAEEGASNQGRNSRNVRIAEFDYATGLPGRQFIYQLTDRAGVNSVIDVTNPDPAADIGGSAQGRVLVISDLISIGNDEFLVIERENRGIGVDNPAGVNPILNAVGLKAIYKIDISGATDVSNISLKGTNALTTPVLPGNPDPPIDIVPVEKTPFFDMRSALASAGLPIPEKIESMTFGPPLTDGRRTMILLTDNDVSVSQTVVQIGGQPVDRQFEIYTLGAETRYTDLDDTSKSYVEIADSVAPNYLVDQGPLPVGFLPLPTYIYSVALPLVSSRNGDWNGDGILDVADVDLLSAEIKARGNTLTFDLNGDTQIDRNDLRIWVADLRKTWFGDANLDSSFNNGDLVSIFQAGQYEDSITGNSTWATGDWNADGEFTTSDLVVAFQDGGFEQGPRPATSAVPEPTGIAGLFLGFLALRRRIRGRG